MNNWSEASVWRAVRFERVMASGRTRPLLLECAGGGAERPERRRFVTKAIGLPEVHSFSLAHELLGARLAELYGLAAPRAEVVTLSPEFITAVKPELDEAGLTVVPGLGVGGEFIPDLLPFAIPARPQDSEMQDAAAVYVFDLLTQNPDRLALNPNVGRAGARVAPYDFETAFSFRLAILKSDPWRVGGLSFPAKHVFYRALQAASIDWPGVFARFRSTPLEAVARACSTMPSTWASIGDDVLAHLTSVHAHWVEFEQEVAKSLGSSR